MRNLLVCFDLTGAVVTVDVMRTQADTAQAIVGAVGDYWCMVKKNTPTLHATIKALLWVAVPAQRLMAIGRSRRITLMVMVTESPERNGFTGQQRSPSCAAP